MTPRLAQVRSPSSGCGRYHTANSQATLLGVGRIIFLALATLYWPICAGAADLTGRASIIAGDTMEIHDQRIRPFGIDAPESRQTCEADGQTYRCGQQAALALADPIGQLIVACERRDVDRYGRIVAVCRAGGEDLNALAGGAGLGLGLQALLHRLHRAGAAARPTRLGIWRGAFTAPWDWRHGQRTATSGAPTTDKPTGSAGACCKICSTGKACGNSCIAVRG